MNSLVKIGVPLAVVTAILYQILLKTVIFNAAGVGRHVQPVSDFPYQCRRIHDPRLQACEDMWFSENTRQLFLACSNTLARKEWMPNVLRFNVTGRSLTDAVVAMDIDSPVGDSFQYRVLEPSGYESPTQVLHLVGLTGIDGENGIDLFLVNAKPSVDPATGKILA